MLRTARSASDIPSHCLGAVTRVTADSDRDYHDGGRRRFTFISQWRTQCQSARRSRSGAARAAGEEHWPGAHSRDASLLLGVAAHWHPGSVYLNPRHDSDGIRAP